MSLQAIPEHHPDLPSGPGVFTLEQIRCLEEAAILLPEPQPNASTNASGKRKVSAAFSAPRPVSSSSTSSSSSSASVATHGFQPNVIRTFDIPMAEESVEVLEYIGFVPDVARLIYDRYCGRPSPSQNPDDLMAYVTAHLASLSRRQYDNMSHQETLADVGLTRQIQEAITDPRFSHIFGTQTLTYWAQDTVETNYAALLRQQQLLQSHANKRIAHKKKHKRPRHEPSREDQDPSEQQPVTATINMTPQDFQFPDTYVIVQPDANILADHISLYKGKAYDELRPAGDIIESDGTANLRPLSTYPGGDFNFDFNAQYWTPKIETAEEYRKFAERRSPTADTCIIHIQVPRPFINSLRMENLWYSPNWKEYIWTCRRQATPHPKFDHLWRPGQADIVRGPICSTLSTQLVRIRRENIQSHITEDNVMQLLSGRKATQWVFVQRDVIDRLAEHIRGKMHFIIFEAAARFS
ncbi:hypothetical protein N7497_001909 [Penicillium chrysogenum]|nr:hypothetical protein N7497_001909 [Penicillium chrysogenum]